jgi:hypothetical protein
LALQSKETTKRFPISLFLKESSSGIGGWQPNEQLPEPVKAQDLKIERKNPKLIITIPKAKAR